MSHPRSVPQGHTIRFGPPRTALSALALDTLRTLVADTPAIVAAYHAGIDVLAGDVEDPHTATPVDTTDLLGLDIPAPPADPSTLIQSVTEALAPTIGTEATLSVTILTAPARATVQRITGPIGAGGALERAAAATLQDPTTSPTLVEQLLDQALLVPTTDGDVEAAATDRGEAPGSSTALTPAPLEAGDTLQAPVLDVAGRPTILACSSMAAVAHAAPGATGVRVVTGARLFANWPDEVCFALDLGTPHAIQLGAQEAARLRELVR